MLTAKNNQYQTNSSGKQGHMHCIRMTQQRTAAKKRNTQIPMISSGPFIVIRVLRYRLQLRALLNKKKRKVCCMWQPTMGHEIARLFELRLHDKHPLTNYEDSSDMTCKCRPGL